MDYGSQYSQLITRRVRECHVYCEMLPWDAPAEALDALNPRGIILSGGPNSVYDPGAPYLTPQIMGRGVPILGICYGMQLLTLFGWPSGRGSRPRIRPGAMSLTTPIRPCSRGCPRPCRCG